MAKEKLYLVGTISLGIGTDSKKKSVRIGAGTDVTEIDWPDKKYGLKDDDRDRMLSNGTASLTPVGGVLVSAAVETVVHVDQGRLAEFVKVAKALDQEKPEHFTEDGKPEVNALKSVGFECSAQERDAIWDALQAMQF